eukprot:ANDGO_01012.mRNA.1 Uncharacterized protein At3g06530
MATDLQRQLSQIQQEFGGTSIDDPRRLGQFPSFLYTPLEAQLLDTAAVYDLGLAGFTELKKLNPEFSSFSKLFDISIRNTHRDQLTKDANQDLDAQLKGFLRILSPYCLSHAAHQVFEFLIRKYEVHDRCVDSVMAAILPFHETAFFGSMMKLVRVHDNRWAFLANCQKEGAPCARETLVNRCLKDFAALEFVMSLVSSFVAPQKKSRVVPKSVLSFVSVVLLECLRKPTVVFSSMIRVLIPYLDICIHSVHDAELQLSCMSIIVEMCARTTLIDKVSRLLVESLCSAVPASRHPNLFLCLMVVFQTQSLKKFPKKALASLVDASSPKEVSLLLKAQSEKFDSSRFLQAVFRTALTNMLISGTDPASQELLDVVCTDVEQNAFVIKHLFYVASKKKNVSNEDDGDDQHADWSPTAVMDTCSNIVSHLSQTRSTVFDAAVREFIHSQAGIPSEEAATSFISECLKASWKFKTVRSGNSGSALPLEMALHASDSAIRASAIRELIGGFNRLSTQKKTDGNPEDLLYLENALISIVDHQQEVSFDVLTEVFTNLQVSSFSENAKKQFADSLSSHLMDVRRRSAPADLVANIIEKACDLLDSASPSTRLLEAVFAFCLPWNGASSLTEARKLLSTVASALSLPDLPGSVASPTELVSATCERAASFIVRHNLELRINPHSSASLLFACGIPCLLKGDRLATFSRFFSSIHSFVSFENTHSTKLQKLLMSVKSADLVATDKIGSPSASSFVDLFLNSDASTFPVVQNCLTTILFLNLVSQGSLSCADAEAVYVRSCRVADFLVVSAHLVASLISSVWKDSCMELVTRLACHHSDTNVRARSTAYLRLILTSLPEDYDFSFLLPFVLLLLSDKEPEIRRGGLAILGDLKSRMQRSVRNSTSKSLLVLIPSSSRLDVLRKRPESNGLMSFIDGILLDEVEIVRDAGFFGKHVLASADSQILMFVLAVACRCQSPQLQYLLLSCLKDCDLPDSLSVTAPTIQQHLSGLEKSTPEKNGPVDVDHAVEFTAFDDAFVNSDRAANPEETVLPKDATETALHLCSLVIMMRLIQKTDKKHFSLLSDCLKMSLRLSEKIVHDNLFYCVGFSFANRLAYALDNFSIISNLGAVWGAASSNQERVVLLSECASLAVRGVSLSTLVGRLGVVVSAADIVSVLKALIPLRDAAAEMPRKRSRKSDSVTSSTLVTADSAAIAQSILDMTLLFINNSQLDNAQLLFPVVHEILAGSQSYFGADVGYPFFVKSLMDVLQALLDVCGKMPASADVPLDQTCLDLLNATGHSSIRSSVMRLLSAYSLLYPERVLRRMVAVMSVFGSLSVNSGAKDDVMSFSALEEMVRVVVPHLMSLEHPDQSAFDITNAFVQALERIPAHRRVPLFAALFDSFSARHSYAVLVQLIFLEWKKQSMDATSLCSNLLTRLLPSLQLSCVKHVVSFAVDVSEQQLLGVASNESDAETSEDDEGSDTVGMAKVVLGGLKDQIASKSDVLRFLKTMMSFGSDHVSSEEYKDGIVNAGRVSAAQASGDAFDSSMQEQYLSIMQSLLQLSRCIAVHETNLRTSEEMDSQQLSVTQDMNRSIGLFMDAILHFLSIPSFLAIVSDLLSTEEDNGTAEEDEESVWLRRKALLLLTDRIERFPKEFSPEEASLFVELVPEIGKLLKSHTAEPRSAQISLLALDILARRFAKNIPEPFLEVVPDLIALLPAPGSKITRDVNKTVLGAVLVTTSSFCATLSNRLLQHVPRLFPLVTTCIDHVVSSSTKDESSVMLLSCSLHACNILIVELAAFISPFLSNLFSTLLRLLYVYYPETNDTDISFIIDKTHGLLSALSDQVAPRLSLPALMDSYTSIITFDGGKTLANCKDSLRRQARLYALHSLFNHLERVSKRVDRELAVSKAKDISRFYLTVFQFRQKFGDPRDPTESNKVEDDAFGAFLTYVLKLNEATFRPLFARVMEWATASQKEGSVVFQKTVVFFRFFGKFVQRFKIIALPFFGMPGVQDVLNTCLRVSHIDKASGRRITVDGAADDPANRRVLYNALYSALNTFFVHDVSEKSVKTLSSLGSFVEALFESLDILCSQKDKVILSRENDTAEEAKAMHDASSVDSSDEDVDKTSQNSEEEGDSEDGSEDEDEDGAASSDDADESDSDNTSDKGSEESADNGEDSIPDPASLIEEFVSVVCNFALVLETEEAWKPLHFAVLARARSQSISARLASIRILDQLFERVGERYMAMLPETIQYLAELMEDSNTEIAGSVRALIRKIEKITGEDLQPFFS